VTRRLRIVSVCRLAPTPTDPAAGVFVLNRLAAMQAQSDVTILQPILYTPVVKPLPDWAKAQSRAVRGVTVTHAPMFYLPGILKSVDSYWLERAIGAQIARLHRESPIDAIDAHFGYFEGVGCVRLGKRLGIPVFITLRGVEHEDVARPRIGPQLLGALHDATGCISVSHSLRDRVARFGADPARIEVVHNAIDASTFRRGEREAARTKLSLGAGPLVVSVGNLVSGKRHHVLLDAFAAVRREIPDATLAIVGGQRFEPRYPDDLLVRARALGIEDVTRFVGNIAPTEVALWLQAADTFALATAREGCCNAVLEALAAGLPVVTTGAGDNAHFVKDNVNGYIVPVDDAGALARALTQALRRSDWDRDEISRRLLAEVGSWQGVATKVLDYMRRQIDAAAQPHAPARACARPV
jgi:glycosyltransferase involved in cell wall biosynthesis